MGSKPYNVLPALDFNAVHSGDPIARAYFGEAAKSIRAARREAAYLRTQCEIERARRVEAELSARTLSDIVERIVEDRP